MNGSLCYFRVFPRIGDAKAHERFSDLEKIIRDSIADLVVHFRIRYFDLLYVRPFLFLLFAIDHSITLLAILSFTFPFSSRTQPFLFPFLPSRTHRRQPLLLP
jgi:hypothetical protein